ncbi:MAG TPA: hypothetical protein VKE95_03015 [Burkholderiales bacterium]|nr:hypothetical protein [Burkholderiales bacterium]
MTLNGMMDGMMGWMMGIGLLGWVLVSALLVTIVFQLIQLWAGAPRQDQTQPSKPGRGGHSELP